MGKDILKLKYEVKQIFENRSDGNKSNHTWLNNYPT